MNNILVISNDAGVSQNLIYLALNEENYHWTFVCLNNSPAENLFQNMNLNHVSINSINKIDEVLEENVFDYVFYGTGWQIDFSKILIEKSKLYNFVLVAFIDHWVNYKDRFFYNIYPENIVVMDKLAYQLAKEEFPNINIIQLKNYYWDKVLEDCNDENCFIHNENKVLFISEPTSIIAKKRFGNENGYGFTEYKIVEDICSKYDDILIRLHPSDEIDKYSYLEEKFPLKNIEIINFNSETLASSLKKANLVIGIDGMALFLSYILNLNTISYIPNSNRKLTIPLPEKYLISDLCKIKYIDFSMDNLDINIDYKCFKKALSCMV